MAEMYGGPVGRGLSLHTNCGFAVMHCPNLLQPTIAAAGIAAARKSCRSDWQPPGFAVVQICSRTYYGMALIGYVIRVTGGARNNGK